MQIAQIGPWEFEFPDGWRHKPNETSNSYFENEDGTRGLYVATIKPREPKPDARHLADYIQETHFRGFTKGTTNSWEVLDKRTSIEGDLARSAWDIYDKSANYRVLCLVVSTADEAVQFSIHDYMCQDYAASRGDFLSLEISIARVAAAAQPLAHLDSQGPGNEVASASRGDVAPTDSGHGAAEDELARTLRPMTIVDVLEEVRNHYLQRFVAALAEYLATHIPAASEILFELNRESARAYKLYRLDMGSNASGEFQSQEINLSSHLAFEPMGERLGGVSILLSPIAWNGVELKTRLETYDPQLLEQWTLKWLDVEDHNAVDSDGLQSVIHNVTVPSIAGGALYMSIDFGSAPVASFTELVSILAGMGATSMEVWSSSI